jgi:hypothetical protein
MYEAWRGSPAEAGAPIPRYLGKLRGETFRSAGLDRT